MIAQKQYFFTIEKPAKHLKTQNQTIVVGAHVLDGVPVVVPVVVLVVVLVDSGTRSCCW